MKILIDKVWEGECRITVLPRPGAHMAPVQVRGRDRAAVAEELAEIIRAVGLRERQPPPAPL